MDKLQKALTSFLKTDDVNKLAQLLEEVSRSGKISYETAERIINESPEDILILGYGWRLLLPVRAAFGGDWEDLMLTFQPEEIYQMPNVVKNLVRIARETGNWDPEKAIIQAFEAIGEPDSDKMPRLIERMASKIKGHRVTGMQIKKICAELGLEDKVDLLLSELKACGIMSPKLSSHTDLSMKGSPIYELNPSLFVGTLGRETEV